MICYRWLSLIVAHDDGPTDSRAIEGDVSYPLAGWSSQNGRLSSADRGRLFRLFGRSVN